MGFEYVSKLPTPDEIRAQFPLAPELAAEKARKDAAIRDVFTGDSDKFLVIIGPCSADREDAVIDYVNRLAKVQEKVKDKLFWFLEPTPTNQEQPVTAIRDFYTSQIRKVSQTYIRV